MDWFNLPSEIIELPEVRRAISALEDNGFFSRLEPMQHVSSEGLDMTLIAFVEFLRLAVLHDHDRRIQFGLALVYAFVRNRATLLSDDASSSVAGLSAAELYACRPSVTETTVAMSLANQFLQKVAGLLGIPYSPPTEVAETVERLIERHSFAKEKLRTTRLAFIQTAADFRDLKSSCCLRIATVDKELRAGRLAKAEDADIHHLVAQIQESLSYIKALKYRYMYETYTDDEIAKLVEIKADLEGNITALDSEIQSLKVQLEPYRSRDDFSSIARNIHQLEERLAARNQVLEQLRESRSVG